MALRLLPFLFTLYVLAYLDRINVGFAQLQMKRDLGFTDAVYGFGAGVFFVGYLLFEVPSNLMLQRFGARRWIARIMLSWGLISTGTALVSTPAMFYTLRFLLGVAEAGFFPGIILYLGYWFPLTERARAVSIFMTATAVAGIVGGPVSGALLSLDGWAGLRGWQWLFIVEGVPTLLAGLLVWCYLPDHPGTVSWLTDEERQVLRLQLHEPALDHRVETDPHWSVALRDRRCWLLSAIYFTIVLGFYTLSLWLPQIVHDLGHESQVLTGMLSAVPYCCAVLVMVPVGMHSDRSGERCWHVALGAITGALGLLLSTLSGNPLLVMTALCIAASGIWSALGPFWALPARFMQDRSLAVGIALINSLGNMGGFVGPYMAGLARSYTGGLTAALQFEALLLIAGAASLMLLPATAKP